MAQQLAVAGVEGHLVVEVHGAAAGGGHPGFFALRHLAFLVDEAGEAGVGGAGEVAAGFDAAQGAVAQQLVVAGRVVPPRVVGEQAQQGRAPVGVLGGEVAVDGLVADERGHAQTWSVGRGREHGALGLAAVGAHGAAQVDVRDDGSQQRRNFFHARHEARLVVKRHRRGRIGKEGAAVEHVVEAQVIAVAGRGGGRFFVRVAADGGDAREQGHAGVPPQPRPNADDIGLTVNGILPVRFFQRRFRPDDEAGLRGQLLLGEREQARELLGVGNKAAAALKLLLVRVHVGLHHHHLGGRAFFLVIRPNDVRERDGQRHGKHGHQQRRAENGRAVERRVAGADHCGHARLGRASGRFGRRAVHAALQLVGIGVLLVDNQLVPLNEKQHRQIGRPHPHRAAQKARVLVPLHPLGHGGEAVAEREPGPGEVPGEVQLLEGQPVDGQREVAQHLAEALFGLAKGQQRQAHEQRVQHHGGDAATQRAVAYPPGSEGVPEQQVEVRVGKHAPLAGPGQREAALQQQVGHPADEEQQRERGGVHGPAGPQQGRAQ